MKRLIGDRFFYKKILTIMLPIMVQNGITNFVSLLDNIMVGRVGTEQMTGVSIISQLIFVFNLAIFGAISGPGIFTAQYYGKRDNDGVRNTLRIKLILGTLVTAVFVAAFLLFDEQLIGIYLTAEEGSVNIAQTLQAGKDYLSVAVIGLFPFAISNCYGSVMRETSDTTRPMLAGIIAVMVNLTFNYLLIYGSLGFPELGVVGAAVATVMSRFVEMGLLIFWTHRGKSRYPYAVGLFRNIRIPRELISKIAKKGTPLLLNESLWGLGTALLNQTYSLRGLNVVAALNITLTIENVFSIASIAMGNTISIMVGQRLGANQLDRAVDEAPKMIAFSTFCGLIMGGLMALSSQFFPLIYNTGEDVKALAGTFILIFAAFQPVFAMIHGVYFTLRAGGKTFITMLFDSLFVTFLQYPIALVIGNLTDMPVVPMIIVVNAIAVTKIFAGIILIKKKIWVVNMVSAEDELPA